MKEQDKRTLLFGALFFTANRLEVISDRYLKSSGITIKQWMLMAAVDKTGGGTLRISDAARMLQTSHQNIKQMALTMRKNGFIEITADAGDRRVQNLVLTDKCRDFWKHRHRRDEKFIAGLLDCFSDEEAGRFTEYLFCLYKSMEKSQ